MSREFPEFFEEESVVWTKTFYSDITKTTPIDPSTVVFKLLTPVGAVVSPTVVNEPGTGNFSASHVLDLYGRWEWRWQTETPRIVDQGTIFVKERNVPE